MMGRQEAHPHFRYVEAVFDPDYVLFAFIIFDVELESAFAHNL
jgi:hypothetical protein